MDDLNDSNGYVTVEPVSNPGSLQQWLSIVENGKANGTGRSDIAMKVKQHLSSLGWLFAYVPKTNKKRELSYISPKGKWFYSLVTACLSVTGRETATFHGTKTLTTNVESETTAFNGSKTLTNVYYETTAFHGTKTLTNVDSETTAFNVDRETPAFNVDNETTAFNVDVCCVRHYGGDLLLCDGCPSAFHHTCIGLTILPEEEVWFCPRCSCDICGSMVTLGNNSKLMTCEQCLRKFHLNCLKENARLVPCRGWFCSKQCYTVFTALQSLLGRRIVVGEEEGLVWSLIRAPNDDEEQISKLKSAVKILHQGFMPTKDPFSGRDLVEELIFRKDANGVGRGFYTVLIERNNKPVTAAVMRVYKDVAEIPLVATLANYRRRGMCRVLMDELEKQMFKMGVRRLVLPAAEEVLSTWCQGFGFKVMETWESLEFKKHGMLDFLGTVRCHKFLRGREVSGESSLM